MYVRLDAYLLRHPWLDASIHYCFILIKCYLFVYLLTNFICKPVFIQGSSMYPTIVNGSFGVSAVYHEGLDSITRFDIIMFQQGEDILIKRVIAMEYDTIEVKDDTLYLNQEAIDEPYLQSKYRETSLEKHTTFTKDFGPVTLSENEYFVMGDNRLDSYDSRIFGAIQEMDILCKDAFLIQK